MGEFVNAVKSLDYKIDRLFYWLHITNVLKELREAGASWIGTGALDAPFIIGSIALIWIIMLGADWPRKWLFWGWVVFWVARGFIFV